MKKPLVFTILQSTVPTTYQKFNGVVIDLVSLWRGVIRHIYSCNCSQRGGGAEGTFRAGARAPETHPGRRAALAPLGPHALPRNLNFDHVYLFIPSIVSR